MITETIERLDWPLSDIYMHCTTEIEARLRLHACDKEPELISWLRSFPEDSLFWDVGANVGPYTLVAASLGHQVVAFEPSLTNAARLQANVLLNGFQDRVLVAPIALGSHSGTGTLHLTSQEPGATHGARYEDAVEVGVITAAGAMFSNARPDYAKIDVDGAEIDVLRGFGDKLPRHGLLIETSDETDVEVCELLEQQGFVLRSWFPRSEPGVRNVIFDRR